MMKGEGIDGDEDEGRKKERRKTEGQRDGRW